MMLRWIILLLMVLLTPVGVLAGAALHHDLVVTLKPAQHTIEVQDTVSFPRKNKGADELVIILHAGLEVESSDMQLEPLPNYDVSGLSVPVKAYRITSTSQPFTLRYSGKINDSLNPEGKSFGSSTSDTSGDISDAGVFLANTTAWYPLVENSDVTFSLDVTVPAGWKAVSQGARLKQEEKNQSYQVTWVENNPQQDIYLIAAPFSEFSKQAGKVETFAFLRSPDKALADRYLDITAQYIDMYQQLLGAYPYQKFALVENFWETGYGMPSFTLLGPTVIRLPFIIYSSYPHEILHNWWGNGVYVDYKKGNWSEGLTSYLADHLLQEQRGKAMAFRRDILQKYADFVSEAKDFPLTEFTARHGSSSEAIGYGKMQMVFHMLRQTLGDKAFVDALRTFYEKNRFKQVGFDSLQGAFQEQSQINLGRFFEQWVRQSGAPEIGVSNLKRTQQSGVWHLSGTLQQRQSGGAYQLAVPLAVTLEGEAQAQEFVIEMDEKEKDFAMKFSSRPLRIDVDPEFDLFRRVSRAEIPPALSQVFGAENVLIVLPSQASKAMQTSLEQLVAMWRQSQPSGFEVKYDNELVHLPKNRAVWILGGANKFSKEIVELLSPLGVKHQASRLTLGDDSYDLSSHSLVLTARTVPESDYAVAWLAVARANAVPGLARKLPHYRKYSYLAFSGDEPVNELKGQWSAKNSPMTVVFDQGGAVAMAGLKERRALAQLPASN